MSKSKCDLIKLFDKYPIPLKIHILYLQFLNIVLKKKNKSRIRKSKPESVMHKIK